MVSLIISILILLGIVLLIIEILVLPGITVAGVGGFVLIIAGIVVAYKAYGITIGSYIIIATLISLFAAVWLSLKSKTWNKVALHSEIDGKMNTMENNKLHIGDIGVTISKMAPMGKVMVNDIIVEAKSNGEYIDVNSQVEIIKINESNIVVKPLI